MGQSQLNMQAVLQKVIPRSVRLIWKAEKSNVEQTVAKIGQIRQSMQAVPLAGSIL